MRIGGELRGGPSILDRGLKRHCEKRIITASDRHRQTTSTACQNCRAVICIDDSCKALRRGSLWSGEAGIEPPSAGRTGRIATMLSPRITFFMPLVYWSESKGCIRYNPRPTRKKFEGRVCLPCGLRWFKVNRNPSVVDTFGGNAG
jgi:hypothetical protein